jgi:hypothetical protein
MVTMPASRPSASTLDDDVPVGDDANGPGRSVNGIDPHQAADVILAHQLRRFQRGGVAVGDDDLAVAEFSDGHDELLNGRPAAG